MTPAHIARAALIEAGRPDLAAVLDENAWQPVWWWDRLECPPTLDDMRLVRRASMIAGGGHDNIVTPEYWLECICLYHWLPE